MGGDNVTNAMRDRIGGWLLVPGNTRERLAELLGMSHDTLARRMDGSTDWSWTEARKLAEILGCEVSDLQ